jgi:glutamate carboxypeptidase
MESSHWQRLLVEWAEINSGSGHLAGLLRMCEALERAFASIGGACVERVTLPGTAAPALRVRMRPEAAIQVLLCGHYDTVFEAAHPFQTCRWFDSRTLCGPGVADMKGGLVMMLKVLTAFERTCAHANTLGWQVLIGPDEEIGSPHTRELWTAAAAEHDVGLVFEPCRESGNIIRARKGTGIYCLSCHGRAAHAGRDASLGRNAILALAGLLPGIDALNREHPGSILVNVGRITGGEAVNSVPGLAQAWVNVRISRASDQTLVEARFAELAAECGRKEGYRLEISGGMNRPPKPRTPLDDQVLQHWLAIARECGVTCDADTVDGGSDGNFLSAAGLPSLDGLGVQGGRTHSAEEFVRIDSLATRAEVTLRFLEKLAAGDIAVESSATRQWTEDAR